MSFPVKSVMGSAVRSKLESGQEKEQNQHLVAELHGDPLETIESRFHDGLRESRGRSSLSIFFFITSKSNTCLKDTLQEEEPLCYASKSTESVEKRLTVGWSVGRLVERWEEKQLFEELNREGRAIEGTAGPHCVLG